MADNERNDASFEEEDHRVAFIFNAPNQTLDSPQASKLSGDAHPAKRRKTTKAEQQETEQADSSRLSAAGTGTTFPVLFNGAESLEAARLRRELFERSWPVLEGRIQRVLREANTNTLDEVSSFLQQAAETETDKLTAGFIITGPNIASQDLLFEQLAERLRTAAQARFVRLRAAEAPNLKAVLKKIIRDATARTADEEEGVDVDVMTQGGRKYLDYDLEVLHVFLKNQKQQQHQRRVVVAFQDSEAFESGLLTDLTALFHSWRDRIRFDLLFGVATSVELFQARLLKSTARQLYGAQFDVVQAHSVLETVIRTAVAGTQATVRVGPALLRSLVERQQDQVAGVQMFVSSLQYAYMCHFYANPLSVLLTDAAVLQRREGGGVLQPEHIQAVRTLDSFQAEVEAAVEARQLGHAQSLLEDDDYLVARIREQGQKRREYVLQLLRSLHLVVSSGLSSASFTDLYTLALSSGIAISQASGTVPLEDAIKRVEPDEFLALTTRLLSAIHTGSPDLGLDGWAAAAEDVVLSLTDLRDEVEGLIERSKSNNSTGGPNKPRPTLKSKYSAQSRILRTTVVAQKVQLSHDSATLTDEDKAYTAAIDTLYALLHETIHCAPAITDAEHNLFLHEAWFIDTTSTSSSSSASLFRDIFVPRPGATFARALARPHDYLGCACCGRKKRKGRGDRASGPGLGTVLGTSPATAVLHQLLLETGALVNVADLWTAYSALVAKQGQSGEDGEDEDEDEDEGRKRELLVGFYRGLAELRVMGFVKGSKKKVDHVAKVKWL
ncbi:origin recognition complex subunit 3 N-terminus-domain-containing protein [Dichotomopilus funicola]|uniref:Origin recognition complex subunit 3 N-terminus-domain-containing protein n=1 Tax=Dichotomopilus funicola TaxID=1934379 RepID=A0AAN6V5H4_9PEZI|nr:origin recognition complex subunit 3 N-terminus-domain-containing protein [Dichotomopilus funicola]